MAAGYSSLAVRQAEASAGEVMAHRYGYKAVSSLPADSQSPAQRVHIELCISTAAWLYLF